MGASTNVNLRTVVHKGSSGVAIALPDVCKTPAAPSPLPIPYPNIARSSDTDKGSKKVKIDGKPIMLKNSTFSRSMGDEAGTLKGVASSTNMAKAKFAMYSFDVKVEGKNVPRLGDPMTSNGNAPNTATIAEVQPPKLMSTTVTDLQKIADSCNRKVNKAQGYSASNRPSGTECTRLGTIKHKCCEDSINAYNDANPASPLRSEVPFDGAGNVVSSTTSSSARSAANQAYNAAKAAGRSTKDVWYKAYKAGGGAAYNVDVIVLKDASKPIDKGNIKKVYDFKFNCKDNGEMSSKQKKNYTRITGKTPEIIHSRGHMF